MSYSSEEVESIRGLLRDNIRNLTPYSSARDDFGGQADVWLDANENPLSPPGAGEINRYPSARHDELREVLSRIYAVDQSQIFAGHGSDEAIDLLLRAFCTPEQDSVMGLAPSYGMYNVSAQINGVAYREVQLKDDFSLDAEAVKSNIADSTKILFVCSPNNPTGNTFSHADIQLLCNCFDGLLVVDEAYIDFAPEYSAIPLLEQNERLVILRTFSKAWGLAGLRLGTAIAHPELINVLLSIKPPYNLNRPTLTIARELESIQPKMLDTVKLIVAERDRLTAALHNLDCVRRVYPSQANFLLVQFVDAKAVYVHLLSQAIVVRDRSKLPGCENCLRITVGTSAENDRLLNALSIFQL